MGGLILQVVGGSLFELYLWYNIFKDKFEIIALYRISI